MNRSRTRTGARPRITRYARNNRNGWMANPLTEIPDLYAGFAADDPLWTPPSVAYTDPTSGLVVPGVAGNGASVANFAALNTITELETISLAYYSDVTPSAIVHEWGHWGAAGIYHMVPYINTVGRVGVTWSTDGTAPGVASINTTVALGDVGITDGSWVWLRRRFTPNDGAGNRVLTVHYSTQNPSTDPSAVTWTLLETVTVASVTTLFTGSTASFIFGGSTLAALNWAGRLGYVQINASIGGAAILAVDFRRARCETFTASTGQTVTISSYAAASSLPLRGTLAGNSLTQATSSKQGLYRGALALLNNVPVVDTDGVDDLWELLTGVNLPQPFSFLWVGVADTIASRNIIGLLSTNATAGMTASAGAAWSIGSGGTNITAGSAASTGTPYALLGVYNTTSSAVEQNGVSIATGTIGSFTADQLVFGAGRVAPATYSRFMDAKTYAFFAVPGDLRTKWYYPALRSYITRKTGIVFA